MSTPLPKIYGFKLPSELPLGSFVSVTLCFPDVLEYRAAFNGQINMLGKWFQWAHTQQDYQDIPELNKEVAQQWVDVLVGAVWEEGCMTFCERLIECITTDNDVKAAFRNFIMTDPAIAQYIQNIASVEALSLENRGQNLLKPDACDPDFIFNQASVLIQLLHDVTEDLFEAIEVGTNAIERMSILSSGIPVWGQIIPADELLSFADQLVEEVAEDYTGAYDEALYDAIRCKVFCAVKDDCDLTLARLIEVYLDLLEEEIPSDPIEALVAIVGYLNVGDFGTDAPVYAMHLLVLYLIQLQQNVFGIDFTQLFLRVVAAGDTGNNDWEVLCEDCAEPPPEDCWYFEDSQDGWEGLDNDNASWSLWVDGVGFKRGTSNDLIIERAIPEPVTSVTVTFNEPQANVIIRALGTFAALSANSATSQEVHVLPIVGDGSLGIGVWVDNLEATTALISICVDIAPP